MPPRRRRPARLLPYALLALLLPFPTAAAAAGAAQPAGSGMALARLAGELAVQPMARLVMLHPAGGTTPWAAAPLLRNATLQPVFAAVDRCPDPYHRLRTIRAQEIQWQRVQRPPPPPPPPRRKGGAPPATNTSEEEPVLEAEAAAAAAAIEEEDEEEVEEEKEYMVFLLSKPADYFSRELDALVAAVAPAFPSVLFLRGLSTHHHGLVGQMSLRSLPKMFLFENSLLKSRFKGPNTLSNLLAFLSTQTNQLPRAAPGRVPISSLPPEALRFDDDAAAVDGEEMEPFPLVLPPAPLPPPRLGPLYWLAWVFLLSQALGPRVAGWRRKKRGGSGTTDDDGAAQEKAAAAAAAAAAERDEQQ